MLVKVIDRILYKLDDLVRPYVHKVTFTFIIKILFVGLLFICAYQLRVSKNTENFKIAANGWDRYTQFVVF